ncbi:hypothetical protein [Thermanaerovibrio acidaminovorans]|uniref:hypothetical protein n=1 Tax=Thermanaerovibrio acidaminovorans TaxID=81462 RepID=UPI001F5FE6EE|nr:hypothetical protein [Thermanaerovibrio acidaminovorans]
MGLRRLLTLALLLGVLIPCSAQGAMLPPHKRIAVMIFESASGLFRDNLAVDTASTVITQALIENGYPVVNDAQVKKIKADKRSELLRSGDAKAIKALGKTYDVRIFLVGKATLAEAVRNDFGTYTATATVTIQGYSTQDGKYLLSQMASSKQLGGTPDEASQKALEAASRELAQRLISGQGQTIHGSYPTSYRYRDVTVTITGAQDFQQVNAILQKVQSHPATRQAMVTSYSSGNATIGASFGGDVKEILSLIRDTVQPRNVRTGPNSIWVDL